MSAKHALRVDGARVSFGGTVALDAVSLTVPRGRVLAVLGPSGCGKSTLLRGVAGLQRLDAGTVTFDGADVTRVPTHKRDFALMFQDGQLFGHLDVAANVGYALARRGVGRTERASRVAELLELVGLPGFESRSPATLSGGQQQRVALARALAARPRLLLLDEPLSALDRGLRERLAGDLRAILTAENATALFVTHDHTEALTVADDIAVMRAGRLVQHGPAREVWAHPADAETADFLGFHAALDAEEAQALGLTNRGAEGRWALRRSAIRVVAVERSGGAGHPEQVSDAAAIVKANPSTQPRIIAAQVVSVQVADEATHLTVSVPVLSGRVLPALAYPGSGAFVPEELRAGDGVGIVVDTKGAAALPS